MEITVQSMKQNFTTQSLSDLLDYHRLYNIFHRQDALVDVRKGQQVWVFPTAKSFVDFSNQKFENISAICIPAVADSSYRLQVTTISHPTVKQRFYVRMYTKRQQHATEDLQYYAWGVWVPYAN